MPRHRHRSRAAARPSSASGGSSVGRWPIASKKPAIASSPSRGCRRANGAAPGPQMRSSVCTKSSSDGSRRRRCCHQLRQPRCCFGRCSLPARSTCERLTVGGRFPKYPSVSQLTSRPDSVLSKCRRSRHPISTHIATAPVAVEPIYKPTAFKILEAIMVDKDRIQGSAEQAKGKVKEVVGKVTGDSKLEGEGKADQFKGKVQNAVGGLKDTLRGK